MSIEIPKACENCPRVTRAKNNLAKLTIYEDAMIRGALSTTRDEVAEIVEEMRAEGMEISVRDDDGELEETITEEGADKLRRFFDANIEQLGEMIQSIEQGAREGMVGCIGAVGLRAVDAEGARYDISVCQSPVVFEEDGIVPGLPADQKVDLALIRRVTDEQADE